MAHRRLDKTASLSPPPTKKVAQHKGDDVTVASHVRALPDYHVAIDFGTTYTTVAFTRRHEREQKSSVFTIEEFPGDRCVGRNGTQVPTEIWYLSRKEGTDTKATKLGEDVLYGYEITRRLELPEEDPLRLAYKTNGLVSKPKLLLDESPLLKDLRRDLLDVLQGLKKNQLIKKNEEVIEHLLLCFLKHTKAVLERDHAFNKSSTVEMTLAVPVCWSARANATMSICLQNAMMTAQFGSDGIHVPQLFIVNEAEAAAMHALGSDNSFLNRGECFILLDCGGGTTDAGTYRIAHDRPLRLEEEVSHPTGALCGSSDLNTRMRSFAAINLTDETYLEDADEGITIYNLIDSEILPHFESEVKRAYDPTKEQSFTFRLHGLRKSSVNPKIRKDRLVLTSADLQGIFDESLKTIERLLLDQIEHARRSNTIVDKVVLVGGFGDSPALKEYLKASLQRVNNQHRTGIELVPAAANTSATGVAIGAILRAQNKKNGPKRIPCRSVGVLFNVEYNPERYPQDVLQQLWSVSKNDGLEYITRTLRWVIKVGVGEIKPVHEFEFVNMYCFEPCDEPGGATWSADEELYASDTCIEDFYTRHHPKNRGKTSKFGKVEFDVTHLQDHIELYTPPDDNDGWQRYEVTLRICIQVIDRHLEFTAYWPADDADAAPIRGTQTCFDLSAVFKPGTA